MTSTLAAQEFSAATRAPFLTQARDYNAGLLRRILSIDVDGDGALDLWESGIVHRNDGRARFPSNSGSLIPNLLHAAPTEVFVDGRTDIIARSTVGLQVLVNRAGRFNDETARSLPFEDAQQFRFGDVLLLDYDGDGARDMVLLNSNSEAAFSLDARTAIFTRGPTLPFRRDMNGNRVEGRFNTTTAIGDFDNDGFDDFVLPETTPRAWAAIAGGAQGILRNESTNWVQNFARGPYDQSAVGDFDGDGALDIILNHSPSGAILPLHNEIAQGNGFVDFRGQWPFGITRTESLLARDLDGDGTDELLAGNPDGLFVLGLTAGGGFSVVQGPLPGTANRPVRMFEDGTGDLDGDGQLDVVVDSGHPLDGRVVQIWLGQGNRRLAENGTPREVSAGVVSQAVAFADFDGDGDQDALVNDPNQTLVQRNDGRGSFTPFGPNILNDVRQAAVADIDGDGDLDAAVVLEGTKRRILGNDGRGVLQARGLILPDSFIGTYDLDLVDVDGDGFLDLLCANQAQDELFLGNGTLNQWTDATATALPVDVTLTTDIAPVDVDGDGDLDLYLSSSFSPASARPDRLWINQGGVFTPAAAGALPPEAESWEALPYDFDGDADQDLVILGPRGIGYLENVSSPSAPRFQVATGSQYPTRSGGADLVRGPLDDDGLEDIVVLQQTGELIGLRALPAGGFRLDDQVEIPGQTAGFTAATIADLDGDGDLDVVGREALRVGVPGPARVLLNRTTQIEAPFPARLGGALELAFSVLDGGVASGGLAWPVFSPGLAPQPVTIPDLGTLRLDPNALIPEAAVFIGTGTADALLSLPVPNQASLLGAVVHTQALVAPRGDVMRARLSGLVSVEIIR